MTVYRNGIPEFPDLQFADVLFLAGNPARKEPPDTEHVALVAYSARPTTANEWLFVRFYGLPESVTGLLKDGLQLQETRYWERAVQDEDPPLVGRRVSVWNLIMRSGLARNDAEALMCDAAVAVGDMKYKYARHFHVVEEDGVRKTNCLGFVVDFLSRPMRVGSRSTEPITPVPLLVPEFDEEYTLKVKEERRRRHPSIGHLAQCLHRGNFSEPYGKGMNAAEAEATALAKAFLDGLEPRSAPAAPSAPDAGGS
ncbi:hypothetical protein [Prosthecobacter sp.]|uniref:hypothetical protein n=1 Tax=Prosthecobacter sp. TaxID=1965333 RepID=UPI0037847844